MWHGQGAGGRQGLTGETAIGLVYIQPHLRGALNSCSGRGRIRKEEEEKHTCDVCPWPYRRGARLRVMQSKERAISKERLSAARSISPTPCFAPKVVEGPHFCRGPRCQSWLVRGPRTGVLPNHTQRRRATEIRRGCGGR